MPLKTTFNVAPTFPLDAKQIRNRMWRRVALSPLTLAGAIVAVAATALTRSGLPGLVGLTTLMSGGVAAYWYQNKDRLTAEVVHQLVAESNDRQDIELARIVGQLRANGYHQYATCLGKFLLLKQHVESELHRDRRLTGKKQEIEMLVDSLCDGICSELTTLTSLESQLADVLTSGDHRRLQELTERRQQHYERIMHAYRTLYDTTTQLDAMLHPGLGPKDRQCEASAVLDHLIERLRTENKVAERVDQLHREVNPDRTRE